MDGVEGVPVRGAPLDTGAGVGAARWAAVERGGVGAFPFPGIAGVILMQYLPFADAKALAVYDAFERGAYRLVSAER